jgi:hypothetical protein
MFVSYFGLLMILSWRVRTLLRLLRSWRIAALFGVAGLLLIPPVRHAIADLRLVRFLAAISTWPHRRLWYLALGLGLSVAVFRDVRSYAQVGLSAVNRAVSGNFTSWGRVIGWWLLLFGFSVLFFWDPHHLTIGTSYRKDFYDARGSAVAAPPTANPVTSDVCSMLARWDAGHSFMLSARLMIPVAPPAYDEVEPQDNFNVPEPSTTDPNAPNAVGIDPVRAATFPEDDLVTLRCRQLDGHWKWNGREFGWIHSWNPVLVALIVRVLSNLLLTLFGATIATHLSRKPT